VKELANDVIVYAHEPNRSAWRGFRAEHVIGMSSACR